MAGANISAIIEKIKKEKVKKEDERESSSPSKIDKLSAAEAVYHSINANAREKRILKHMGSLSLKENIIITIYRSWLNSVKIESFTLILVD